MTMLFADNEWDELLKRLEGRARAGAADLPDTSFTRPLSELVDLVMASTAVAVPVLTADAPTCDVVEVAGPGEYRVRFTYELRFTGDRNYFLTRAPMRSPIDEARLLATDSILLEFVMDAAPSRRGPDQADAAREAYARVRSTIEAYLTAQRNALEEFRRRLRRDMEHEVRTRIERSSRLADLRERAKIP